MIQPVPSNQTSLTQNQPQLAYSEDYIYVTTYNSEVKKKPSDRYAFK